MLEESFTARRTAELAGLSTTMVDYLCRTGVLVPSHRKGPGRGRKRLYSFGDIVILRALGRLLKQRVPVRRLKKALHTHKRLYRNMTPSSDLAKYMITDGKDIIFEEDPGKLVKLDAGGQLVFAFLVDIHKARAEVIDRSKIAG